MDDRGSTLAAQSMALLLRQARTVAIVGLSPKPHRDSYGVAQTLKCYPIELHSSIDPQTPNYSPTTLIFSFGKTKLPLRF